MQGGRGRGKGRGGGGGRVNVINTKYGSANDIDSGCWC